MKFLVSVPPETVGKGEIGDWAVAGEPVIPWFPAPPSNVFLSTVSFKRSPYARVAELPDLDPDELSAVLKKQYPGLPGTLHDNYVLAVARAAEQFKVGTLFQIFAGYDEAKLKVVDSDTFHTLWAQQPIK